MEEELREYDELKSLNIKLEMLEKKLDLKTELIQFCKWFISTCLTIIAILFAYSGYNTYELIKIKSDVEGRIDNTIQSALANYKKDQLKRGIQYYLKNELFLHDSKSYLNSIKGGENLPREEVSSILNFAREYIREQINLDKTIKDHRKINALITMILNLTPAPDINQFLSNFLKLQFEIPETEYDFPDFYNRIFRYFERNEIAVEYLHLFLRLELKHHKSLHLSGEFHKYELTATNLELLKEILKVSPGKLNYFTNSQKVVNYLIDKNYFQELFTSNFQYKIDREVVKIFKLNSKGGYSNLAHIKLQTYMGQAILNLSKNQN